MVSIRPASHASDRDAAAACESIERLIRSAIDRQVLPGAVVRIERAGQRVFEAAFGLADRETGRTHTTDDLFYLGSSSKPLAVTALLSLVDRGLLTLDTSASRWIPELAEPRLRDKTRVRSPVLRELLSHTSGMFGNADATRTQKKLVWSFSSTLAKAATRIARQPLNSSPGRRFCYGGASMTVAGRIAELAAEMEFDELADSAVFSRLGMGDTFYRSDAGFGDRFSVLYAHSSGRTHRSVFQPHARPGSFVLPAGGIISCARDLTRFLRLHLGVGECTDADVLSTGLATAMRTDMTDDLPMDFAVQTQRQAPVGIGGYDGYGMGWILGEPDGRGRARTFFHGGAFGTLIWGDRRSGLGVALLTHVPLTQVIGLWDDVLRIARRAWGDERQDRQTQRELRPVRAR